MRGHDGADRASQAIYDAVFEATSSGIRTADLGGDASMTGFTEAVMELVQTRLGLA